LISESDVGRAVASTRQNAGNGEAFAPGSCGPGGVNPPAAIIVAAFTVTSGIVREARFAQGVPAAEAGRESPAERKSAVVVRPQITLRVIPCLRETRIIGGGGRRDHVCRGILESLV
jgi:hypothetical protein